MPNVSVISELPILDFPLRCYLMFIYVLHLYLMQPVSGHAGSLGHIILVPRYNQHQLLLLHAAVDTNLIIFGLTHYGPFVNFSGLFRVHI